MHPREGMLWGKSHHESRDPTGCTACTRSRHQRCFGDLRHFPSVLRTLCTQERDPSSLDSLVEAGGHESPGERGTSRSDLGDERAAGWETASLQGELLTADGTSSPGGTEGLDLQQEQLFRQVFTQQQAGGQIWAVGEDGQGHRTKIS